MLDFGYDTSKCYIELSPTQQYQYILSDLIDFAQKKEGYLASKAVLIPKVEFVNLLEIKDALENSLNRVCRDES